MKYEPRLDLKDDVLGSVADRETLEWEERPKTAEELWAYRQKLFGSEELNFRGSDFYTHNMTESDVANTICMINVDSVFAGTYRYVYKRIPIKNWRIKWY